MLNNATLMGRLTADPERRQTPNNIPVARFALAVDRNFSSQSGERQTDFIDITAWRKTAEFVSRYFHKGMLVAVQGSIQTRSYTDNQGIKRKAFEIVADNVYFAEPKRDSASAPSYDPAPASAPAAPTSYQSGDAGDFQEIEDDDLPF